MGVDPCATRAGMRAANSKVAALAALVNGWAELPGTAKTGLTVAEALRMLQDPGHEKDFTTLRDTLLEESGNGKLSPAAVSYRLRGAKGRVVGGKCIQVATTKAHGGAMRWIVQDYHGGGAGGEDGEDGEDGLPQYQNTDYI
jgi:hypothetical protein